jgi:hypothetical protein
MVAMVAGNHVAMKIQKSIGMVSSESLSKMKKFIPKKPLMAPWLALVSRLVHVWGER